MKFSLSDYPGMNRFVLDWLEGKTDAFLPRVRQAPSPVGGQAGAPDVHAGPPDLPAALIESNKRWGLFVRDEVEAWARGDSVALIAGQQVGFAGGPLYTLAKIASLVKMKRQLRAEGKRATIFFWLATEDHDFDEAAALSIPVSTLPASKEVNRQLDLVQLAVRRGIESRAMVGPQPVPEPLIAQLLALFDLDRPSWLREGIAFRDSFAELLAMTFDEPIVLVDALLPELRRAGGSLFRQIASRADDVQKALAERSAALQSAGYSPQVIPREGDPYSLFFKMDSEGNRELMSAPFDIDDPACISTSALTRPLLQDFVFRPAVFIGGPSEVAYYAQIAPLHDLLGVPMPKVALRGHALVAPKRLVRAFDRYAIEPREVFQSADAIIAEREPEAVQRVKALAADAKRDLLARIEQIGEIALPAEHALARAIHRSIGHIEYHFGKLTERAIKGLARKDRERWTAVRELVATLHPDRHVQDRVVGWLPLLLSVGQAPSPVPEAPGRLSYTYDKLLVERMIEEIEPDSAVCKVVAR